MNDSLDRRGLAFGFSAYFLWGLFPLLMHALEPASAVEITAQRAWWALLVCLAAVGVARRWRPLITALRTPRVFWTLALAAVLIAINWLTYVFSVVTDRVNSASLGYYINPLVLVALGILVLGERLRRLQVVAVAVAAIAVTVIGIEMGGLPWIALVLALSFGTYGLIKKRVNVDVLTGLTVETLVLTPFALATMVWLDMSGRATFLSRGESGLGWGHDGLLVSTGAFTVAALMLFSAGAQRIPLNVVGLLQYIAPTMMFMLAVWQFGEPMPPGRWVGFALVWVALILITVDSWRARPGAGHRREAMPDPVEPT